MFKSNNTKIIFKEKVKRNICARRTIVQIILICKVKNSHKGQKNTIEFEVFLFNLFIINV